MTATSTLAPVTNREIVDAATRREFLAIMAAAGVLAACGDGGGSDSATGAAATTTAGGEEAKEGLSAGAFIVVANLIDGVDDFEELERNPLWSTLPAVQAGRVFRTDFFINYGSVFTARRCVELVDEAYRSLA